LHAAGSTRGGQPLDDAAASVALAVMVAVAVAATFAAGLSCRHRNVV
jgi:hypothetical protein